MVNRKPCRIALIGHDAGVAADLLLALRAAGHACGHFTDGAVAVRELEDAPIDVLLVDRALPGIAPAALMMRLRARIGYIMPVIAIADGGGIDASIAALDDGADECLVRPVPMPLLLAHVAAAARRGAGGGRIEASIGHLRFQPEGTRVCVDDLVITLTAKEYALALLLCRNLGKPLSRDHILATIWGGDVAPLTRTLDVHVSRLRSKLDLRDERGFRLSALYGRGYRLDHASEPPAAMPSVDTHPPYVIPKRSASPCGRASAIRRRQAR